MTEIVYVLVIVAGVIVKAGAAGLAGPLIWRWRRSRLDAARAVPPVCGAVYRLRRPVRAAQPLPPQRAAVERPGEVYLDLHGVTPEQIAAVAGRLGE
jgi:hypothetical protein